ncbi:ATP-binding protein [Naasia lichenicola]|uniref:ATP-binding protein n=1 Tax=Naasia lichenicola TaxID=2565933 RepID=A0A4S4FF61_9MICO|nr:ATP-binding protein [Naasia lichenicola]
MLERSAPSGSRAVVLIDGRSGSGKSTLATLLAPRLGAELVRLDDVYPGWSGLAEASRMVVDDILLGGQWTGWDWTNDRPADRHIVDLSAPLIIDGCGSISRRSSGLVTSSIWVELDAASRRRNALLRDGAAFEPFWDMWALQEEELIRREDPRHRAQVVVRGSDFSLIR